MAEEEDNPIPVVLCATLLPSLLVVVFVSHCDLFLQNIFRVFVSMVCCHEGRVSKMEEVCAFRQILPFAPSISIIPAYTLNTTTFACNGHY